MRALGLAVLVLSVGVLAALRPNRERRTAVLIFLAIALAGWLLCLGSHAEVWGVRVPLP